MTGDDELRQRVGEQAARIRLLEEQLRHLAAVFERRLVQALLNQDQHRCQCQCTVTLDIASGPSFRTLMEPADQDASAS